MQQLLDVLKDPLIVKIMRLSLWVIIIVLIIVFSRKQLKKRITDMAHLYKAQKIVEVVGLVLISFIILLTFTLDSLKDYTIIIGLFTAGIAFTLQELILSIAGSFYIFALRVYKPGDRIEINSIKEDVIDINSMYTTIMEMGEWVSSDNYTGRIVKLSNAFVFKGPIKNYSMDFPFIWDEINIPITYQSDVELAKKLILENASKILSDYTENSKLKWKEMVERYYIEDATLDPTIAIKLTDNWIEINLRYITDYKRRRNTKNMLFEAIEKAINQTSQKVSIASSTIQLMNYPPNDIRMKN
jgi:small-conductance mechanosensitive channel